MHRHGALPIHTDLVQQYYMTPVACGESIGKFMSGLKKFIHFQNSYHILNLTAKSELIEYFRENLEEDNI
jgi:hypothetical protein